VESPVEKPVDKAGKTESPARSFESFEIGESHRSPVRVLEQGTIEAFADVTGDKNPIHLDPEFARGTVFRGTVAHGLLLTSLLAGMAFDYGLLGKNILALESSEERYLAPVRPGDRIRGTVTICDKDADVSKRCGRVRWDLKMFKITGEGSQELVLQVYWNTLVFKERYLRP